MSRGHIIDSIRCARRQPSTEQIATWPDNTNIVDTSTGKIRVRDTGGTKPVVVMVPDGPCVIEHYGALINELLPRFRVICFDMPGLGYSYPKRGFDFGLKASSLVVISVLDALKIEKAIISFSCSNGYIAISVAKHYPERITRLVLAQTPSVQDMTGQWMDLNIPKPLLWPYLGQSLNAIMEKKLAAKWFEIALPRDSSYKGVFIDHALSALKSGACFCLASIAQGMQDISDDLLNGVEIPITMVWGNRDRSHRNTNFENLRDLLPKCEIVEFDGCGHFPNLEQPKAFSALFQHHS